MCHEFPLIFRVGRGYTPFIGWGSHRQVHTGRVHTGRVHTGRVHTGRGSHRLPNILSPLRGVPRRTNQSHGVTKELRQAVKCNGTPADKGIPTRTKLQRGDRMQQPINKRRPSKLKAAFARWLFFGVFRIIPHCEPSAQIDRCRDSCLARRDCHYRSTGSAYCSFGRSMPTSSNRWNRHC